MALPIRTAHDGLELPAIGFGTYRVNGLAGERAIESALAEGYRLLDSAVNYENEGAVGTAIRRSGVAREDVIVTSKLPGRHHAYDEALTCIEESVLRMGLDYIDLYLIHWPNPSQGRYVEAWRALIEAQKRGLVRHIGVSNFLPGHIERLIRATGVTPAVNQVELHPYFQQEEQRAYDEAHGIITEAWSPLARANELVGDPTVSAIAQAHGVSVVEAILRWHVQLGTVALPKSMNAERQRRNITLDFELTAAEMAQIAALDNPEAGRTFEQNPHWHEEM